jgi:small subunit ribosomal protein S2
VKEDLKDVVTEEQKEVVSMRQLLECGVHFGHQTKRWNPKMKKYIFTSRNGIHVIDLQQSIQLINVAYEFVKEVVKNDGTILFVGTKKQAQDAIKEESERSEMPFVNFRWLGGTLTNISTIRQSINKLKDHERIKESGEFDVLPKKEQSKRSKAYNKLTNMFDGIKSMIKLPSALFIIDTQKEQLAIQEAKKLNIPIIGVVDTNANPQEIDYPIPANDDAIRAVKLICSVMADAVVAGKNDRLKYLASLPQDELEEKVSNDTTKADSEKKEKVEKVSKSTAKSKEVKSSDKPAATKPKKTASTTKKSAEATSVAKEKKTASKEDAKNAPEEKKKTATKTTKAKAEPKTEAKPKKTATKEKSETESK